MPGFLDRLAPPVWVAVGLIVTALALQVTTLTPEEFGLFLGRGTARLLAFVVVLLPYMAVFVALIGIVMLVFHHVENAQKAGISAVVLIAIDVLWHVFAGAWITAALTGAA